MQIERNRACSFCRDAANFLQKLCKLSAIELARFAEMQLIFCKNTFFFQYNLIFFHFSPYWL